MLAYVQAQKAGEYIAATAFIQYEIQTAEPNEWPVCLSISTSLQEDVLYVACIILETKAVRTDLP